MEMTEQQSELAKKHGTPAQFERAVWKVYGDLMITLAEAGAAIAKYRKEWEAAGLNEKAEKPV